MKPQSAKAKGRNLQKWVRERLIMARAARQRFPHSIECKNVEKLNIWEAYEQSKSNCGDYEPIVVIKKNHKKPLVVVDAEYFIKLFK